ncbi:hypothetical protein C7H19_10955 [Aphanothece hegewaldii CCALA 016]|uniref:Uncharacterized protein n=1 Tax=Aphanothece hegewaldii CCALA 016 TaxID=2107694 RepID=A0A2T1LXX5_9CHRO|nr:hypothetical protein [Aphanothece hegewaldii]PSF37232.1 hypothetical protein C7H19_10955 [Aphanothece hegewaldii CCALA 016]
MKKSNFSFSLLILTLVSGTWLSHPVNAQCLQADVSVQYNISGSRQPTKRTNDVVMESEPGCRGNASVTTGVQGNIGGTTPVEQHRMVRHQQRGQGNPTGINGSTVQIRSNVGIDVYDPSARYRK